MAATRVAVRAALEPDDARVLAAVSGGADSLALAAGLAFECDPQRPTGLPIVAGAVVVDHGLQPGSHEVAEVAAAQCRSLGLDTEVVRVAVAAAGEGGPEARARTARYEALDDARRRAGAQAVLLGHTLDDQAEQVLLGLARGSGARSLGGMPARRGPFRRPFLGLGRATTQAACLAQNLQAWSDPHNADPRYLRVRARHLLADAESQLPGVSTALARSADLLRDDADALDGITATVRDELGPPPWSIEAVDGRPVAIRRRLWRLLAIEAGVPAGSLRFQHLADIDALAARWHGQGPVDLPDGFEARRLPAPPRLIVLRTT